MSAVVHRVSGRSGYISPASKTSTNPSKPALDTKGIVLERTDPMVYVIFVSLLFDLLAFTIILPLLPSLLEYYKSHDDSGLYQILTDQIHWFQQLLGAPERYNSVLFGGFLGSMFSFLQFVSSPLVGGLSDYYGRKPLMLFCTVGLLINSMFYINQLMLFRQYVYLVWYSFIIFVVGSFSKFCYICFGTFDWRFE